MRAVASFGNDPTKIEIILPPGDPQVMLAEVATKPNFQLFGTAFSYSYPEEELAEAPCSAGEHLNRDWCSVLLPRSSQRHD
jgi:hypothetical protein